MYAWIRKFQIFVTDVPAGWALVIRPLSKPVKLGLH